MFFFFCKKTSPSISGKRTLTDDDSKPPGSIRIYGENVCQERKAKVDIGTQTEFKRQVSVKSVRKYIEVEVEINETIIE